MENEINSVNEVGNYVPPVVNEPVVVNNPVITKKKSPVLTICLAILAVLGIGFGVYMYFFPMNCGTKGNNLADGTECKCEKCEECPKCEKCEEKEAVENTTKENDEVVIRENKTEKLFEKYSTDYGMINMEFKKKEGAAELLKVSIPYQQTKKGESGGSFSAWYYRIDHDDEWKLIIEGNGGFADCSTFDDQMKAFLTESWSICGNN